MLLLKLDRSTTLATARRVMALGVTIQGIEPKRRNAGMMRKGDAANVSNKGVPIMASAALVINGEVVVAEVAEVAVAVAVAIAAAAVAVAAAAAVAAAGWIVFFSVVAISATFLQQKLLC